MSACLVNLSPLFAAHRVVTALLEHLGPEYFARREAEGPAFRVDPGRLERAVEMGAAEVAEKTPWLSVSAEDLERARRHVQRLLVGALARRSRIPRRG